MCLRRNLPRSAPLSWTKKILCDRICGPYCLCRWLQPGLPAWPDSNSTSAAAIASGMPSHSSAMWNLGIFLIRFRARCSPCLTARCYFFFYSERNWGSSSSYLKEPFNRSKQFVELVWIWSSGHERDSIFWSSEMTVSHLKTTKSLNFLARATPATYSDSPPSSPMDQLWWHCSIKRVQTRGAGAFAARAWAAGAWPASSRPALEHTLSQARNTIEIIELKAEAVPMFTSASCFGADPDTFLATYRPNTSAQSRSFAIRVAWRRPRAHLQSSSALKGSWDSHSFPPWN